ncbi:MAG TPA: hypothetical protein VGA18_00820 [Rhodothermales bacterium]
MPRIARPIEQLPEDVLEEAALEFQRCALKALEGQIRNQRELADRLGWPESTLSSALQGHFTFHTWPKICRALGRDPIAELARGRAELRRAEDQDREDAYRQMLERAEADTMVAFCRKLPSRERSRVVELLLADGEGQGSRATSNPEER